jgi:hypothetical protein
LITLSRKHIHLLRSVFRRGLGVTSRSRGPAVALHATAGGFLIRAQEHDTAIEYRLPGDFAQETLVVPYAALAQCEGRRDEPVTFRREGESVILEWTHAGAPQAARFGHEPAGEFPLLPAKMQANPARLITAVRDALETADDEAARFALNCLRLRGAGGEIAATDSRQLLVQDGFGFPWTDDVLVRAPRVFLCSELAGHSEAEIGCNKEWVTLRTGPWTVHMRIAKEGRFPKVENHVPAVSRAVATLRLSPSDAEFLQQAVKRLPAGDEPFSPVTVDLNGQVTVRAKAEGQSEPTEVRLESSRRTGQAICFSSNRKYLARAAALGFQEIYLFGPESPACCRDEHRAYVWALIGKEESIPGSNGAVSLPTATADPAVGDSTATSANNSPMSPPAGGRMGHVFNGNGSSHERPGESASIKDILEQAEGLKHALRDVQSQVAELVLALKRHRRHSRLVRSTLASLRQLQTIDA